MTNPFSSENNSIIKTPDQNLRVFVSSTLKELKDERNAAKRAIKRLKLAPVMFELGARPYDARDLYRAYLQQSHIFIGIYANQYGWIAPNENISGLEDEYNQARNKPKLIYLKKSTSRDEKLKLMLTRIRDEDGITYNYFTNSKELYQLILNDLALLLAERFEMSFSQKNEEKNITKLIQKSLPSPPTKIIGRQFEIKQITDLILNKISRLITLTGPGGSGKTRLALEVATSLLDLFERIFFVELAAISDPKIVDSEIAHNLGIRDAGSKPVKENLKEFIQNQKVLLILDNFEQIIGAASLIAELIETCTNLVLIVTSRIPLRLRTESEIHVPPLAVPINDDKAEVVANFPSVVLFIQRAKAIKSNFSLKNDDILIIGEICRKLDGLPLAIELAAARIKILTPKDLLIRLEKTLHFLTSGARDLPERQQTMRKTIAWSYDLLENTEKILFRRMSVFTGGCSLNAIEDVCTTESIDNSTVLDILQNLVEKNLVQSRHSFKDQTRFYMFETIREYAYELLLENEEESRLQNHHANYYVELAEKAEKFLASEHRDDWLDIMEIELDNLRTITKRALNKQIEPLLAIRLVGTLGWFWHLRGHITEGRSWALDILKLPEALERTRFRAKALFPAGGLAWSQGDYETSNALLKESMEIFHEFGDSWWQAHSQIILSGGIASLGEYELGFRLAEEATILMRKVGDQWGLAYTTNWLGDINYILYQDKTSSLKLFKESLQIFKNLNDPWGQGESLNHLGIINSLNNNQQEAQKLFKESLDFFKQTDDQWAEARGLADCGFVELELGNIENAKSYLVESIKLWQEIGNDLGIKTCLIGFAKIAYLENNLERAICLFGAIPESIRALGLLFVKINQADYETIMKKVSKLVPKTLWEDKIEMGKNMSLKNLCDYCLELI